MHIAINAQLLNKAQTYRNAGVSNYSRQLLQSLDGLVGASGTRHCLTAFVQQGALQLDHITLAAAPPWLQYPPARIAWEQGMLPVQLHRLQADLVHGLVNVLPLATNVPGVVTVHDLSFLRLPQKLPAAKRTYLARLCQASVKRAMHIIAVSGQTADDLLRYFNVRADKISVIHHGVASSFTPGDRQRVEQFRAQRGLPERFLLYLGTLEPRKNLELLLNAYACWLTQAPARERQVKLILAGAKGWFYEDIFRLVRVLDLERQVAFPGFIPDQELPNWYRAAEAFVYPSLLEGFGMPVLEAMACGAPVLCSRTSSLLEIAGDSALTFRPHSQEDLVACLHLLVGQPALRGELRQRGLARARQFTWEQTARATLEVYDAIAR